MTRTGAIMGVAPPPSRQAELGEFLRLHRERRTPESVGLQVTGRRRTPGLRREEVSQLAGVGLSWYTWLEQGRDVTPSGGVVDALARVLDLTTAERAHLFHLAGVPVPTAEGPYAREASPDLLAIVEGLLPAPAYLFGPRTDVLAWNASATRVLGTPTAAPDGLPNMLWWMFTRQDREMNPSWSTTVRQTLARFRTEHARRHGDPDFEALVAALHEESALFRELWPRHEVLAAQLGTKVVDLPGLGRIEVHHLQSIPTSDPDLRLAQYVPIDEETRRVFARMGEAPLGPTAPRAPRTRSRPPAPAPRPAAPSPSRS